MSRRRFRSGYERDDSRTQRSEEKENSDEVCAGSGGEGVSGDGKRYHGVGIENVEKAMEPMFTTLPELERSGMGFSFMEAFMDELEVRSHPGMGDGSGDETENRCASECKAGSGNYGSQNAWNIRLP